jgi:hypothetical protein
MTEYEDAIQNILRSTEEAKHILQAVIVPLKHFNPTDEDSTSTSPTATDPNSAVDDSGRRILALVNHKESKHGREEGRYVSPPRIPSLFWRERRLTPIHLDVILQSLCLQTQDKLPYQSPRDPICLPNHRQFLYFDRSTTWDTSYFNTGLGTT